MAALSFSNNGYSTLASGISDIATSVTVQTGHGARFPASNFKVTLAEQSPATGWEVCLCTSRTGDVLTITRAQEGTTAIAFASGDYIGNHVTSGTLDGFVQGPASATASSLARFSGTTGKLLEDGAVIGTDVVGYGGALGTPSSGTLTNCTGLPQAGVTGLTTADSPQFAGINLGHASDTTLTRVSAGKIAVEGVTIADLGANTFTGIQRWAKGADVASATALILGTDGNYFDITGTTAITSIGTLGVGTVVKLHFDDALTLTHHATDLILPGGANITTAAGDEAEFVEYAAGDWRCVSYTKASGKAVAGSTVIVQVVEATPYTTAGVLTTIIPIDSTIPQNTEGTELTTVTITPTNASNRLRLEMSLPFLDGSGSVGATAVLFQDSTANAITLATCTFTGAGYAANIFFSHEMAAGTTSATTFKLRVGPSAGTLYVNRKSGGETFGGISAVRLRVTEIAI